MQTGLISGCFDGVGGLHVGHQYIIRECYRKCDYLIAALNTDEYIRRVKKREPLSPVNQRRAALELFVDRVIIFTEDNPLSIILSEKPDILFCGDDYTPDKVVGLSECLSWGGRLEIIPRLPGISTTQIYEAINSR